MSPCYYYQGAYISRQFYNYYVRYSELTFHCQSHTLERQAPLHWPSMTHTERQRHRERQNTLTHTHTHKHTHTHTHTHTEVYTTISSHSPAVQSHLRADRQGQSSNQGYQELQQYQGPSLAVGLIRSTE